VTPSHAQLTLRVPTKLMLAGEYAVLAPGGCALALAVAPGFEFTISPAEKLTIRLPDVNQEEVLEELPAPGRFPAGALGFVRESMARFRLVLGFPPESPDASAFCLEARRVRPGSGEASSGALDVGASAALCVGTVRALAAWAEVTLDGAAVFALAAGAHQAVQKGGSGYDVATIAHGGAVLFSRPGTPRKGPPQVDRRPHLSDLVPVVASTGRPAPTGILLGTFRRACESTSFQTLLARHVETSTALARGLWARGWREGGADDVARTRASLAALDRAGNLGILTPDVERLLRMADQAGFPAKISGAGGGDAVVGFAADAEAAARLARTWRAGGAPVAVPATCAVQVMIPGRQL